MRKLTNFSQYTDKEKDGANPHLYCSNFYDNAFAPMMDKPVRLLEVGVQFGGSIWMWKQYFVNAELILGIDESVHKQAIDYSGPNVKVIQANAYDPGFVATVDGQFDICIDDGSHDGPSQAEFMRLYLPKVKSGGWLVVEDIYEQNYDIMNETAKNLTLATWELRDLRSPTRNHDTASVLMIGRKV